MISFCFVLRFALLLLFLFVSFLRYTIGESGIGPMFIVSGFKGSTALRR